MSNHPEERHERHVSDLHLERYALGELPRAELEVLRRRIDADPAVRERLSALEASNAEILDRHRSAPIARAIEHRAAAEAKARGRATRRRVLAVLAPLATAALVLLIFVPRGGDRPRPLVDVQAPDLQQGPETTRDKGLQPTLRIYRQRAGGSERLVSGAEAKAGDLIGFGYVSAGAPRGVILSIDGRGTVILHHEGPLSANGEVYLGHSYELDDAPDFERFILVVPVEPLETQRILQAATALASDPALARTNRLELPVRAYQSAVTLKKVDR